jgi:hypothetical protein
MKGFFPIQRFNESRGEAIDRRPERREVFADLN